MDAGPEMNLKHDRDDLLKELEEALAKTGPYPQRWPERCRARLSALVEMDSEAARLYAEARALNRVLGYAPRCTARPEMEARIVAATAMMTQQSAEVGSATILSFGDRRDTTLRLERSGGSSFSSRPIWGSAAMLAASLIIGVYIGVSGNAVPTLRNIQLLASNDYDAGIVFSTPVFEPSEFGEKEQL